MKNTKAEATVIWLQNKEEVILASNLMKIINGYEELEDPDYELCLAGEIQDLYLEPEIQMEFNGEIIAPKAAIEKIVALIEPMDEEEIVHFRLSDEVEELVEELFPYEEDEEEEE